MASSGSGPARAAAASPPDDCARQVRAPARLTSAFKFYNVRYDFGSPYP
jgi:hypothetical protein